MPYLEYSVLAACGGAVAAFLILRYYDYFPDTEWKRIRRVKAMVFTGLWVAAAIIFLPVIPRETWTPGDDTDTLRYGRRMFFGTETVQCKFFKYGFADSGNVPGWYAKDRDGQWYLFIDYLQDDPATDPN